MTGELQLSPSYLRSISKYLFFGFLISLFTGHFVYLSLSHLGEIQEFHARFQYYSLFYLAVFSFGFLSLSILYLFLLSRLGKVSFTQAAKIDLPVNFLFLFLLPYLLAFGDFHNVFGFSPFYLVIGSVISIRLYWLIKLIWRNREEEERLEYTLLIIVFLLGMALRLFLLLTVERLVDSDEAVWGLMARHILFKGEHPTVFYGQSYMGSFSAFLAALFFFIFGASSLSLKLVPLLFSIIFLISTYFLTKQIFSSKVALLSFLLVALGSPLLIFYSVTAWGYMEAMAIGNLILILLNRVLENTLTKNQELVLYGLLGFLMGFGLWISVFTIIYIVTVMIFLLIKEKFWLLKRKFFLLFSLFFLGLLPLIVYNLHHDFATWEHLIRATGETSSFGERVAWAANSFRGLFGKALPGLFGIKGKSPLIFFSIYFIYGASVLFSLSLLSQRLKITQVLPFKIPQAHRALLVFTLATMAFFVFSHFGAIYQLSRYILILYSTLAIFLAAFLFYLARRAKKLAVIFLVMVLFSNLQGSLIYSQVRPRPIFQAGQFLQRNQIKYLYAGYWTAYQLTFIFKERIISSVPGFWCNRYPAYTGEIDKAPLKTLGFIFPVTSPNVKTVETLLKKKNISYRKTFVNGYIILSHLSERITSNSLPILDLDGDIRLQLGN